MASTATHHLGRLRTVRVPLAKLYRLSRFPASEPFWAAQALHRFDSLSRSFGVLYCGDSPETAFAESVLHSGSDKWDQRMGAYLLSESELAARHLVTYSHSYKTELLLADLTGAGLKAIGLNNDVSSSMDYRLTQRLSDALHDHDAALDGIQYISRQHNRNCCYAIFERSGVQHDSHAELSDELIRALCDSFNVAVI